MKMNMLKTRKTFFALTVLTFSCLALTVGCGSDLCVVTGKVTIDGSPASKVTVLFSPKTEGAGQPAVGVTDDQGTYKLQTVTGKADGGTTKGDYIVTFSKVEATWDGRSYYTNTSTNEQEKDYRSHETLPTIYVSGQKTPFNANIDKKSNTFDFDLKSKP